MPKKPVSPTEITKERAEELGKCVNSPAYFINTYCKIYDSVEKQWIPFYLWDSQRRVLRDIHQNKLTVILKARQLGISWISLGYALWQMMFEPIAVVSIFSRREEEASYLLGEERLRGMFNNLPEWMKTGYESVTNSVLEWKMANESIARAFSTKSGDGYVATLAIVDEADLSPDLNTLMRSVKPTIVNGGKMIMLSRTNKSEPESEFKNIYRGAKSGENGWKPIFLPWRAHPERDDSWYEGEKKEILSRTGSLDELYEQYPETDTQALSSKTLEKRIPPTWIDLCTETRRPIPYPKNGPSIPGLDIYILPIPGDKYVIGVDTAEGNPNSDESCACVLHMDSGEQVAVLGMRVEPSVFAFYVSQLSAYYNNAPALVERNNHGHTVIAWLEEHARRVRLLLGHDAETHKNKRKDRERRKRLKFGWLSSTLGKTILYNVCTEFVRQSANVDGDGTSVKVIHDPETAMQLADIEQATLRAPEKRHDDRADAFALGQAGRKQIRDTGSTALVMVDKMRGW